MKNYYAEYLVAVIAGVALLAFSKLPARLGGTFICPSSNQSCEYGWTLALLLFLPFLAVILYNLAESA